MDSWNEWVEQTLDKLEYRKLLRSLRPIHLSDDNSHSDEFECFDGLRQWDRASVEVEISETTFQKWLQDIPSPGDDHGGSGVAYTAARTSAGRFRKLILFSGNDYLGLSSHPSVIKAATQAVQKHGMGPRGSALICGYTNYHRLLESSLAELKSKEYLCFNRTNCPMKKKVVITDSLFSMDGDFAPLVELVKLRKKHGFLLAIDDAHATFVCGKTGGGAAELFNCISGVDICIGTLSKAGGCHGGYIACSKKWKQFIQSRGRSFIFSTSTPVPIAAAAHAAVIVAKKEMWRRRAIWNRVQDFRDLTGIPITSPIISLIVGSEATALQASRHLLEFGFHITAIRPPTVAPNSCRLRIALSAAHTLDDVKNLTAALSQCINFSEIGFYCTSWNAARL
ncbi:8-amino-7-oxononanoate synthase isoform X2 [Solanum lycopersicum]|uniref:8-amino-7-oxononanoate synthase isoform X2 n=1 Tax=Solanum lycopersicum TaxID=4081 RepID=UPI0008FEBF9A|nr:8-amino-7-oxononanoate synthase isoform X2 [Solanum lycopersicum]